MPVARDPSDTRFGRSGGGGPTKPPSDPSVCVCGPDVTDQIAAVWRRMQAEFGKWPDAIAAGVSEESACKDACRRVLIPFADQGPDYKGPKIPLTNIGPDINGWDVLPLYEGASNWLESIPSCCTPTNPAWDEDPNTCSHSVQVRGQCWLNGTVNYGTLGIMARLCHDKFPLEYALALRMAEAAIRGYKLVISKEDATLPVAWLHATYYHGPSGVPANPGNRPQCKCTCPNDGSVVTWDYVWEPWKTRDKAANPMLMMPAPPPPPPAPTPTPVGPSPATYVVIPGDSLSKIAKKVYGNESLWSKIFEANKATIGPNPNLIKVGQTLVIP